MPRPLKTRRNLSRTAILFTRAVFGAAYISACTADAAPCDGGTERTVFGEWGTVASEDRLLNGSNLSVSLVGHSDTRYMRLLMELKDAADQHWTLIVRDELGRVLQTFGRADFSTQGEVLTERFPVDKILLELRSSSKVFPTVELRQQIIMPSSVSGVPYYSTKVRGVGDWKDFYASGARKSLADNVAFLMIGLNEGAQPGTCSGVALPPDLLLTNWHCGPRFNGSGAEIPEAFWKQSVCDRTIIDLSWDTDGKSREFVCTSVLAKSQDLDYALLRIRAIEPSASIPPIGINVANTATNLSMVHHPAAMDKKLSTNCRVRDRALPSWMGKVAGATFTHDCDSEGGSSGAPMFDNTGNLIALHHLGYEIDTATGKCDDKNKAIWISYILADIKNQLDAPDTLLRPGDAAALYALVQPSTQSSGQ